MKKLVPFLFLILVSFLLHAQEVKNLETEIKKVTVYLNGAQIERSGKISLQPGVYELVIGKLPVSLDPSSISVEGKGNLTILFVEYRNNYLGDYLQPKIKVLKDSLSMLEKQVSQYKNTLDVLGAEESLLLANKVVGGQNTGLNVDVLKATADFLRTRLTEIKSKQLEVQAKMNVLKENINRLKTQLNDIQASSSKPIGEIAMQVKVNAATTADLTIKYVIMESSWTPLYDIHISDIGDKPKLILKANVRQSTGETWDNVKLTLSTANPKENKELPVLSPWYLYFQSPVTKYRTFHETEAPMLEGIKAAEDNVSEKNVPTAMNYVVVQETPLHLNYLIDLPYTIEGNGKDKLIEVKTYELMATYSYFAVPKLSSNTYLLARLTGWEGNNFLPGEMHVFFQNSFIGKTYFNPSSVEDTLDVSLGIDKNVSIERKMIKDFSSKNLMGNYKKVSKGWEIVVKNNKNKPIDIRIEDQIPLSTSKEITVDVIELSGGSLDEKTGKVTWNLQLKPRESASKVLKYSVKYPKDKVVFLE